MPYLSSSLYTAAPTPPTHTMDSTLDDAIAMAYVKSGSAKQTDTTNHSQRMAQAKRVYAGEKPSAAAVPAPAAAPSLNASQNERLKALRQKHLQKKTAAPTASMGTASSSGPHSSLSGSSHNRASSAMSQGSSCSAYSMSSPDSAISATFDGCDTPFGQSEDEKDKFRSVQQELDALNWAEETLSSRGFKRTQQRSRGFNSAQSFDAYNNQSYSLGTNLSTSEGHPDNLVRFTAKGIVWIGPESEPAVTSSHRGTPSISSNLSTASTQSTNSLYTVQDVSYMYSEDRVQIRQNDALVDMLEGSFCGEKDGRPVMKRLVW